jgi:hypothetical protein
MNHLQKRWKFRYYSKSPGNDDLLEQYNAKSKQAQAKLRSRLSSILCLPIEDWYRCELAKPLRRDGAGLVEIRFLADRIQQRPLGFVSGSDEFTLLFWAEEKGWKWVPRNACDIAQKRKAEVERDRSYAYEIWMALE